MRKLRGRVQYDDPFRRLIEIARGIKPSLRSRVSFTAKIPSKGAKGCVHFPDGGGTPHVLVSANLPVWGAVDIMAHELAHVIAGPEGGHGPKWRSIYAKIHRKYLEEYSDE